jgi:hypothetical protein
MGKENDGKDDRNENTPDPFMLELLDEAMKLIRAALKEGRPHGIVWEAKRLYEASDDPSHKSEATKAAFLSNWPSFARYLAEAGQETESLSKEQIAVIFIHHTFKRWRRKTYRDKQMDGQVARGYVPGEDGELMPFNPEDRKAREESVKNLQEEIAFILGKRSVRDRMVLEMKYFGELNHASIVQEVRKVLPGEPISPATISRIVERFADELRDRLNEE